ncbi:MAG: hypothetical protein HC840_20590 [Leptolyngbyaceae cyanobacterium RM2_2_4]|nr:hypothetical protein [Leptolyngbyaceae cyanobacterium RM2_2_4]
MFWDLAEEDHVLGIYDYPDLATLLANFKRDILTPAEEEVEKISIRRQVKQKKKTKTRS